MYPLEIVPNSYKKKKKFTLGKVENSCEKLIVWHATFSLHFYLFTNIQIYLNSGDTSIITQGPQ
jgi:hypothetical protein